MFIRIFYERYFKDISLQNFQSYSIGSNTNGGFDVPNSDMENVHIKLKNNHGIWSVDCVGEVYLNGKRIDQSEISASQIYVLSRKNRISMLVIEEYAEPCAILSLDSISELFIGRNHDNNIILKSEIVSGRQATIIKRASELYIADNRSTNGTYVDGTCITESKLMNGNDIIVGDCKLTYKNGTLYVYGAKKDISIHGLKSNAATAKSEGIIFKRSPRLKLDVPTGEIEIQSPPSIGSKPELDKLSMFLPLLATVGIAVVMAIIMSPMMLLYTLPMQAISGFMSYRSYKKQKKQFEEKEGVRLGKYTEHLKNVTEEIEEKRKEQISALVLADPDTNECFKIANETARRLWERRTSDSDFMNIRIGSGEIDFSMKIQIPKTALSLEEDELKAKPQEIYDKYHKVAEAPITCSVLEYPIFGLVGTKEDTNKLVKNMLAQVVTHHCYTEVKVVTIHDKMSSNDLNWVRYLPHSYNDERTQPFVAQSKVEAELFFKNFNEFFKKRKQASMQDNNSYGKKSMQLPFYLFVITAPNYLTKNNPMNDYLFRSKNLGLGIGVVFVVEDIVQLPPECELIIEINGEKGKVYNKNNASIKQEFQVDNVSDSAFEMFGRKLMPLYCESISTQYKLPTKYTFFEMLGIKNASELDIEKNWSTSDVRNKVAAPLGIYGQKELLYLDLHQSAHGSHGLVAGKTGSGKSEVLLSYLVALASLYSPLDVQFVMIDFKGGATADRLSKLPHLNAKITNISVDGKEMSAEKLNKVVLRSLACIKAESLRRQKVLSEAGVKDIGEYIEKYRAKQVTMPLPHLVLFMDEFAELKQNFPEFMKEVVSTSRIGRSLGMHLILATQSPAGVVDDQIWDNSNFKLSLAVLDESNSNAVLKSPEAAHITNPGRGYLKVGNGTLFELFQSGFGGVKTTGGNGNSITQLDAIINRISDYCAEKNIQKLPSICLPPLSESLDYDKQFSDNKVGIGIYDDPINQSQGICNIDVFTQNTMIIGSSKSGKTNLMQCIIRTLASQYSPDEVAMYIIDFSSMILKGFETLNHIGGVVTSSEDEKLKNLFKLLNTEVEARKEKQLSAGVSSFAAYKEAGHKDLPQIVIFIDNLTALKELYLQDNDYLLGLCAEASTYGITFVVANTQTTGIGYKYLTHFSNRIALYCNDSSEYMSLFEHCRERIENIPGRCLVEQNSRFFECQTYLAFEGEKETDRNKEIKLFISSENGIHENETARKIPVVPEVIKAKEVEEILEKNKNNNYSIMFGLDYDSVEPLFVDLNSLTLMGISGREGSGKHNFIKYVVNTLNKIYPNKSEVYILDAISRKLSGLTSCDNVKSYEILAENAKKSILEIEQRLEERYGMLAAGQHDVLDKSELILLVVNSTDLLNELCADATVLNAFRNIVGKHKNMNVCVIVGNYENKNIPYSANELVKKIKDERRILFFDDLVNLKVFDISFATLNRFKKVLGCGDCYYIIDNNIIKIKTILEKE